MSLTLIVIASLRRFGPAVIFLQTKRRRDRNAIEQHTVHRRRNSIPYWPPIKTYFCLMFDSRSTC